MGIFNFWCEENLSNVTYKKGMEPIAQMEYESDKIDKAVDVTFEPCEFSSSFAFVYGDSGAGILFEDDPSKLTVEQLKALMEKVCKRIADEEFPDFDKIISIDSNGNFYPECTGYHVKEFSCNENLSQYTDSMLFDSGEIIASMDYVDNTGNGVRVDLKVCGHVKVFFNDVPYCHPSEFPEELTKLIKNNPEWELDERVCVCENNWFEYIYNYTNLNCGDGILEEGDISKMTTEEIKSAMTELCEEILKGEK